MNWKGIAPVWVRRKLIKVIYVYANHFLCFNTSYLDLIFSQLIDTMYKRCYWLIGFLCRNQLEEFNKYVVNKTVTLLLSTICQMERTNQSGMKNLE